MTSTENNNNSAQTERQQVINWLVAHNYPALPVAPKQDAKKYHKEIKTQSRPKHRQTLPPHRNPATTTPVYRQKPFLPRPSRNSPPNQPPPISKTTTN